MPECGSQIILCNLPVRFDTYSGCSHGCKYCFANRKTDISKIRVKESAQSLLNFIKGKRSRETAWADWDIPIHWGGLSDPFQPVEKHYKVSYDALKIFAETKYPFVVSTKGRLISDPEYIDLLKETNSVIQISLVSETFDKIEPGAPPFKERLNMIEKLVKETGKRIIIRVQPYVRTVKDELITNLKRYADKGVYGITIEGIKLLTKASGFVKVGSDFCYPVEDLKKDFLEIREECHKQHLRFFCAENRLRYMGDDLTCCGTEGLEGFKPNKANLNYFLYKPDEFGYTKAMEKPGSGGPFRVLRQDILGTYLEKNSYKENFEHAITDKKMLEIMGYKE